MTLTELKKTFPKSWQLKNEYIDIDGNVWEKGELVKKCDDFDERYESEELDVAAELKFLRDQMQRQEEEHKKTIEQLLKNGVNSNSTERNVIFEEKGREFGLGLAKEFTEDDLDTEETTYYVLSSYYPMSSYKTKDGITVKSPTNETIHFKAETPISVKTGLISEQLTYCSFTTRIKPIKKFIENSPYFGSTIFVRLQDALHNSRELVTMGENIANAVSKYDQAKLIQEATKYGIDKNLTTTQIKDKLVFVKFAEASAAYESNKAANASSNYINAINAKNFR